MVRAAVWLALRGFRVWYRRTWFYRRLLTGRWRIVFCFIRYDALPRRLEDADALLRGRFRFVGETVEVKDGSIFDVPPPSPGWAEALHSFAWLPPLALAGGEPARDSGHQSDHAMDQAQRALFRAGLVAAGHGAAAGAICSPMAGW